MFPLGSVLFPSLVLPLHVFEPRYRELTRICLDEEREFGVVLIERGSEVGGHDVRTGVGTLARIVEAEELPDGRWALVAVGTIRMRVNEWLEDDPYPRADIDVWPDPEPLDPVELGARHADNLTLLERALARHAERAHVEPPPLPTLSADPVLAGLQLAALAPLGPLDQYRLLAAPSPEVRASLTTDLLGDALVLLEALAEE